MAVTILSAPLPPPPPFSTLSTATTTFRVSPKLTFQTSLHRRSFLSRARNDSATGGGEEPSPAFDAESFFFGGDDRLAESYDEGDGEEEEEEEEEETESSVELFVRFLQSMVKKVSKRAKKASRSVLPSAISTQLVSFAVDGLMLLASLSIVKALLEVVCNIGGAVFASILFLRVIWASASYFQTSGNNLNQSGSSSFGPPQPVS